MEDNSLEGWKNISRAKIDHIKNGKASNEILDHLDILADQIGTNEVDRDKNIYIFNTIVSLGHKKGIATKTTQNRQNRLYEIIVNKVAPFVTDNHIWESHKVLNLVPFETANGINQWRALKRIYRQINDPRFFGNYWTLEEKIAFLKNFSYYPPKDYSTAIAKEVLSETGADKYPQGKGFYIAPSGKQINFDTQSSSYKLLLKSPESNLEIIRDESGSIKSINNKQYSINYTITPQNGASYEANIKENALPEKEYNKFKLLYVDSYEAAYEMELENPIHKGKIAVVNFANETNIGGGFLHGAGAQEEELCRRSNLYSQLIFYGKGKPSYTNPIPASGTIVSPQVTVYKSRDFENLEVPYDVQVITSAADRLTRGRITTYEKLFQTDDISDDTIHKTYIKILSQIASAIHMGSKVFITGAFGAGAFNHNPKIIADLYALAFKRFGGYFDKIVFAIINPYRWNNYKVFCETLQKTLPGIQIYDSPEPQSFFIPEETKGGDVQSNGALDENLNFKKARDIAREKIKARIIKYSKQVNRN